MKYELYIGKHCHSITGPDGIAIHVIGNDMAEAERVARLMFAAVESDKEAPSQFTELEISALKAAGSLAERGNS